MDGARSLLGSWHRSLPGPQVRGIWAPVRDGDCVIPPIRRGAANGWGTQFIGLVASISQVPRCEGPGAPVRDSDCAIPPIRQKAANGWGTQFSGLVASLSQVPRCEGPGAPVRDSDCVIPPIRQKAANGWGTQACDGSRLTERQMHVLRLCPGTPGLRSGWLVVKEVRAQLSEWMRDQPGGTGFCTSSAGTWAALSNE